jgi:ribosomal protein L22
MSPSEPDEKPRRRRKKAEEVSEAPTVSEATDSTASEPEGSSAVDPTASDEAAASAASDVAVEAEDEAVAATEEPSAAPEKAAAAPAATKPAKAPSQPAPTRRRSRAQREPGQPAPVVRAHAKYVRSSARKARLVCDHLRGKSVEEARAILAHTPRAVARDWSKLLESAVANAEHNHELVGEDLVIKAVHADEGPTIKRFRPRAMGRATRIRKRTSHLTILLTPKD